MMFRAVVDTNVAVTANRRRTHASISCQIRCIERLDALVAGGVILIDDRQLILSEYRNQLTPTKGPVDGDDGDPSRLSGDFQLVHVRVLLVPRPLRRSVLCRMLRAELLHDDAVLEERLFVFRPTAVGRVPYRRLADPRDGGELPVPTVESVQPRIIWKLLEMIRRIISRRYGNP